MAATLVAALLGGPVASAAIAPPGPRLTFLKVTLFPYRQDLETVDQAGALPFRITGGGERKRPLPEPYVQPAWSPDGSQIVFLGLAGGTQLYVSNADGGGVRRLRGTHGADEPLFTPDGTSVAFTHYRYQPRVNRRGERRFVARGADIWIVDLAGGAPRHMTHAGNGVFLYPESFSPDGSTLLLSREVGAEQWDVIRINLETGGSRVLLHNAFDPVYSPDGSRIAFLRWRNHRLRDGTDQASYDLFTIRSGGGGLRRLTNSPGGELFPSWDPSGERLAFVRFLPEGAGELAELGFGNAVMEVNADGTCLSTVLSPSFNTAFFGTVWQPGPGREAGRISC